MNKSIVGYHWSAHLYAEGAGGTLAYSGGPCDSIEDGQTKAQQALATLLVDRHCCCAARYLLNVTEERLQGGDRIVWLEERKLK